VVAGLAVALLAAAAFAVWPWPDRITEENFNRIKEGMSRADMEAILGPAGDYTTGPVLGGPRESWHRRNFDEDPDSVKQRITWIGDRGWIVALADAEGRPRRLVFSPAEKGKQGSLDNLLWRAKRQWRKWFPEK
jgi:hypothetical protein